MYEIALSSSIAILNEPYELVICEKPISAQRIAQALGTFKLKKIYLSEKKENGKIKWMSAPFYSAINRKGRHFVICSAQGHLYELVDNGQNRDVYPIFDVSWIPLLKREKDSNSIKKLITRYT